MVVALHHPAVISSTNKKATYICGGIVMEVSRGSGRKSSRRTTFVAVINPDKGLRYVKVQLKINSVVRPVTYEIKLDIGSSAWTGVHCEGVLITSTFSEPI